MNRKVAYIYNSEIDSFNYGPEHPMKPKKVALTHDIIEKSNLLDQMTLYEAPRASDFQMTKFHDKKYIEYIKNYFSYQNNLNNVEKYGIGISSDTPVFPNFYDFCCLSSGASLLASEIIIQRKADVVVN